MQSLEEKAKYLADKIALLNWKPKRLPPGTIVKHHDRTYEVQVNGEWRRK